MQIKTKNYIFKKSRSKQVTRGEAKKLIQPICGENAKEFIENLTIYTKTPNRMHSVFDSKWGSACNRHVPDRENVNRQHTNEQRRKKNRQKTSENTARRRNDATQYPVSVGCLVKTNNLENSNFVFGNTISFVLCCGTLFRHVDRRRMRRTHQHNVATAVGSDGGEASRRVSSARCATHTGQGATPPSTRPASKWECEKNENTLTQRLHSTESVTGLACLAVDRAHTRFFTHLPTTVNFWSRSWAPY